MKLQGKVALITGASRGIGNATATLFAKEGAAVVVNYTNRTDAAEETVRNIEMEGGQAIPIKADVSDVGQVKSMIDQAMAAVGPVDILVNNAGILLNGDVMTMNEEELDRMISVNVKGVINCVRAVVPSMQNKGYGKIVNISSLAGLGTAVGQTTPYALTKAAVISLTKRMAFELGPHGLNVNAICPGFIQTEMLASISGAAEDLTAALATPASKALLGRVGKPEDIANTALFLCTDQGAYITGEILPVSGGIWPAL